MIRLLTQLALFILLHHFVACLYWAITTISTVGYGDLTPNTTGEKVYAMVIEIVGVSMYAVVISLIGSVIATFDSKKRDLSDRSASLQRFVHKHQVPYRLARSMHAHQRRYLHAVHLWRTDEADALVSTLPRDSGAGEEGDFNGKLQRER